MSGFTAELNAFFAPGLEHKRMEKKEIILSGQKIAYFLKESGKAKRMRITIKSGGAIVLTKPCRVSIKLAQDFLLAKSSWILKHSPSEGNGFYFGGQRHFASFLGNEQYIRLKKFALDFTVGRVEEINKIYKFRYNKISIKGHASRWGSCSAKGNLNFNYKICLFPEIIADYVVAHELCHLKEFNHSPRFWELVKIAVPDYIAIRKSMKNLNI